MRAVDPRILDAIRNGHDIAVQLPASRPELRRWVGVNVSLRRDTEKGSGAHAYFVIDFELPKEFIENKWDVDDTDIVNVRRFDLYDESDLLELLNELAGDHLDTFQLQSECEEYPR